MRRTMQTVGILIGLGTLLAMSGGCGEPTPPPERLVFHDPWPGLEAEYASDWPEGVPSQLLERLVVYAPVSEHGPMTYSFPTRVALSDEAMWIRLEYKAAGRPLRIPVDAVTACGSSWFGGDDLYINVFAGDDEFQIADSDALRGWCWKARKPALTDAVESAWRYEGVPLPTVPPDDPQFASREAYDRILCPCLGK